MSKDKLDPESVILSKGYDRFRGWTESHVLDSSYLPLSALSKQIAGTFFMNNYEVNVIMSKYLELWSKNILNPYVTQPTLITTFNLYDCGFVEKFLPDNFDQIVSLMLSACKVLSNIFITSDQILEFVRIFDRERRVNLEDYFKKNRIEISSIKRSTYSLKEFIVFVKKEPIFKSAYLKSRNTIMREIFSEKYVNNIKNRYRFMNENKNRTGHSSGSATHFDLPKEPCLDKLKRIITKEPHPYHYDYSISYNKEENTTTTTTTTSSLTPTTTSTTTNSTSSTTITKDDPIESLLLMIKQEYGYGYRSSRMRNNMTELSSHSICNNNHCNHSSSSILKSSYRLGQSSLKYKVNNGMYQRQHNDSVGSFKNNAKE